MFEKYYQCPKCFRRCVADVAERLNVKKCVQYEDIVTKEYLGECSYDGELKYVEEYTPRRRDYEPDGLDDIGFS